MRRSLLALLSACLLAIGCAPPQGAAGPGEAAVFDALVACLEPPDPASPSAGSLSAVVDRADVVVLAKVAKAERTFAPYHDGLGARRLTLERVETAKGSAPERFVVDDGPCPAIAATEGESLVAFLESTPDRLGLKTVGFPTSALRATPTRTLAQLMSEIRAIRPLDGAARALFERHGWTVTAKQEFAEFDLPRLAEFGSAAREIRGAAPYITQPLETYVALSREVGLDPRPYAGERVERLSFWLERRPPGYNEGTPFGHVLIADRAIVAAWVTVFPEVGPFSVADRAGALAAPLVRPSFPPANRFPDGANIARLYDLASATQIIFKTDTGRNGTITDPALLRDFAAALDATLPTTEAVQDERSRTRFYLHVAFAGSSVPLQYDEQTGVLSVLRDGYSVRPGPAFASVIARIP